MSLFTPRKILDHHLQWSHNALKIVFITVCIHDRRPVLASDAIHLYLRQLWEDPGHWIVGRYILMPDHLHFFASPAQSKSNLTLWIRHWKRKTSEKFSNIPLKWQRGFFDHRIRNEQSYDEKWNYVRRNAVRHRLCQKAEEWRFQGQVHVLGEHG